TTGRPMYLRPMTTLIVVTKLLSPHLDLFWLKHCSTTGRSIVLRYETSLATIVPDILGPAGPPVSPATRPIQFSGAPIYSNSAPWMPDSRCTWSRVRRPPYHVKQSDVIDCPRMR